MRKIGTLGFMTLVLCAEPAAARQSHTVGSSFGIVASVDNQPATAGATPATKRYANIQSGMSSVVLTATRARSTFAGHYDYGMTRLNSTGSGRSETHSSTAEFASQLSKNLKLTVSDTYFRSPDLTSFNFTNTVIGADAAPFLESGTIALLRRTTGNTAVVNFEYVTGTRSSWSFGAANSVRHYEQTSLGSEPLSDVNQYTVTAGYKRKISTRTAWTVGYTGSESHLRQRPLDDARTHDLSFGMSHILSPSAGMNLTIGPSYTQTLTSPWRHVGFNAALSATKGIGAEQISMTFSRKNGATIGVGVSDIHTLGFDHVHAFYKSITVHTAVSLFESRQVRGDVVKIRGGTAAMIVTSALNPYVSLSAGTSYQKQKGNGIFALQRHQVFVSMTLLVPNMWRSGK